MEARVFYSRVYACLWTIPLQRIGTVDVSTESERQHTLHRCVVGVFWKASIDRINLVTQNLLMGVLL